MSSSVGSVLGNECSSLVAVLTTTLHGVGLYSQHWSNVYTGHKREESHQGLWKVCSRNHTSGPTKFDCVSIVNPPVWLLTVQILAAVSLSGMFVSTILKMLYHFNSACNSRGLSLAFIVLSILNGFILLVGVGVYAMNYTTRYMETRVMYDEGSKPKEYHKYLSWGVLLEVLALILSTSSGLMGLNEILPVRRHYMQI